MILSLSKKQLFDKAYLLAYFRNETKEKIGEDNSIFAGRHFKENATEINKFLKERRETLINYVSEKCAEEKWSRADLVERVLMITYASYVVMIESRNSFWPYEYMSFSRRIGELWEPFCALSWDYPVNPSIAHVRPPNFNDVKMKLSEDIRGFTQKLELENDKKETLIEYYEQVWNLVTAGDINLQLDLHFTDGKTNFNVDFKSGFSSNEKGNTNRLLVVASIYSLIGNQNQCEMYVRTREDQSNHYLQTLKNSSFWSVYCGQEAYVRMQEHTGYSIKDWIETNILWEEDFNSQTIKHLENEGLLAYLKW
jgi:hypothetical protein